MDKSVYGIATILVELFIPDSNQHYLQSNLKFSSVYGGYISSVPVCLQNRPPQFVKHCLKTRFQAGEYQDGDVSSVNFQKGEFHVKSSSRSKQKHLVQLKIPSCTCEAWQKSQYPCKHFFAVFKAYREWDFNALPEDYKTSVFITLDTEHLNVNFPVSGDEDAPLPAAQIRKDNSIEETEDALSESSPSELPAIQETSEDITEAQGGGRGTEGVKTGQPSLSTCTRLRKNLQEQLNAVKDVTFLVDNSNILREALIGVKAVYDVLTKNCPKNHGFPLRNSPVTNKLKANKVEYHQVFHKELPKRRKWKKRTSTPIALPDKLEGRRKMTSEVT